MSFADLRNLHRLHLIDAAIVEIRKRAAALDPGRAIHTELKTLESTWEAAQEAARALSAEQSDLELQQKALEAKAAQIDKELYSGKVVNPREVEALQKDLASLKKRRSDMDGRLLELMDLLPPAKDAADEAKALVEAKRADLSTHQKKVLQVKSELERQFKEISEKRADAAGEVPKVMLDRYEMVRQKAGGVGMADVVRGGYCGMCGTHLPEKLIEGAKDGRLVTCESCHRLLYATDGVV